MWFQIGMCRCFAKVYVNMTIYRSFAKVYVNMTIYRSFARASIHVNVTICKGKYSRECGWYDWTVCETVPSCWAAHAELRTWLDWTVAFVGACGWLKGFDMITTGVMAAGRWCVLQKRLRTYSCEDYSAFLCFIWLDLTRQCQAMLNVS